MIDSKPSDLRFRLENLQIVIGEVAFLHIVYVLIIFFYLCLCVF